MIGGGVSAVLTESPRSFSRQARAARAGAQMTQNVLVCRPGHGDRAARPTESVVYLQAEGI